jgi:hypothetical protein
MARYADGAIRPIFGVPGNLIAGARRELSGSVASFSKAGGLVCAAGHITLVGPDGATLADFATVESPVLHIGDSLNTAIAWLPASQTLVRWTGTEFLSTPVNVGPPGVAVYVEYQSSNTAQLLLSGNDGSATQVEVSLNSGDVQSAVGLGGVTGPLGEESGYLLFHDQHGLQVRSAAGQIETLPATAVDLAMERMSAGWVHIFSRSSKRDWALHLTQSGATLFELPQAAAPLQGAK